MKESENLILLLKSLLTEASPLHHFQHQSQSSPPPRGSLDSFQKKQHHGIHAQQAWPLLTIAGPPSFGRLNIKTST